MSNSLPIRTLLAGIVTAVNSAWNGLSSISLGEPRTPQSLPYAVIDWNSSGVSFSGTGATVQGPAQHHSFGIIGRFAYPSDPTQEILLLKSDYVNQLIAQLQTGANFAGIAILPLVSEINPAETDPVSEGAFEIAVTFECVTLGTHH